MAEFIRTGEAVSSADLFNRYDFGIKPAMIRSELSDLEEDGFLEQAYHSAGRVPTNSAYEWYARQSLATAKPVDNFSVDLWDMASFFAGTLGALSVVHKIASEKLKKEGLLELVQGADWGNKQDLAEIVADFEEIDRRLENIEKKLEGQDLLDVFVGQNSPVTRANSVSVFMADCWDGDERAIVLAITPKRTDYDRAGQYFKAIKEKYPKHKNI